MHINEIIQTAAICIVEVERDHKFVFAPDIASFLANKYRFVQSPSTVDDFTTRSNGLIFKHGCFENTLIESLTVFNDGISVAAPAKSDFLDNVVSDIMLSLQRKFGTDYDGAKLQKFYNSKVSVVIKPKFSEMFNQLEPIVKSIESHMLANGIDVDRFETTGITMTGEGDGRFNPGRFIFERRANVPFSENVYYSEAPLSTENHLRLLEELESLF